MTQNVIIKVNGYRLNVEQDDEISVQRSFCGKCEGDHTRITLSRNNKDIATLGDDLTLDSEDEIYGGVVVDENGNVLTEPHWLMHLLRNNKSCMTEDRRYYVGICGYVMDKKEDAHKHDAIAWLEADDTINVREEHRSRICPKCLEKLKGEESKRQIS